jgi:hypothetical protein
MVITSWTALMDAQAIPIKHLQEFVAVVPQMQIVIAMVCLIVLIHVPAQLIRSAYFVVVLQDTMTLMQMAQVTAWMSAHRISTRTSLVSVAVAFLRTMPTLMAHLTASMCALRILLRFLLDSAAVVILTLTGMVMELQIVTTNVLFIMKKSALDSVAVDSMKRTQMEMEHQIAMTIV